MTDANAEYSTSNPVSNDRKLAKKSARRQAIVDSAARLYASSGIKRTSIAKVMDDAGLTRELFYYYFNDKDELVACVVDQYVSDIMLRFDRWVESAEAEIPTQAPLEEQMAAVVGSVRMVLSDEDERRKERISVVMESGRMRESAKRIIDHMVQVLRSTPAHKSYFSCSGEVSEDRSRLILCGIGGMLLGNPSLTNEYIAVMVCPLLLNAASNTEQ